MYNIVNIKRENWKGKFRVVAREKGKLITWGKWSRKFTIGKATSIFKQNNTFRKDLVRTRLKNVSEVIDFSDSPVKPSADRSMFFQYFIEGFDKKNNIRVSARSRQFLVGERKEVLRDEALQNFYKIYAQKRGQEYDSDIGKKLFEDANASITRQGFVYYTRLTDF